MREAVIVGAARTPIGSFLGALAEVPAPKLGSIAIRAAVERAGVAPEAIGEVYMGCVLPAGQGQAPARQASIGAGIPNSVGAVTVNKVCGSGLQAVWMAARTVQTGDADAVVAGGMESMSNSPYLLERARTGLRMGHAQLVDSMIKDGLWDVYGQTHMGNCAELCARERKIDRAAQDAFAVESYRRALAAQKEGRFRAEIVPVEIPQKKGEPLRVEQDEEPGRGNPEKLGGLRPAFDKEGTVTAANASKLNDGGAAVVVMARDVAEKRGLRPLARIVAAANHAQAPEWFTTAPAGSITKALDRAGLKKSDIDLWEINEAFAVVALANLAELGLDAARVNVNGGAVALGHPIGASGCRILVTLLHALRARNARYGCASLCIGGGEGIAMIVERL
ncbi:MAG: acetyl-CoA C-acetyltransferase [Myxococcota bacterium]